MPTELLGGIALPRTFAETVAFGTVCPALVVVVADHVLRLLSARRIIALSAAATNFGTD
jgi:hypothetical protein